ncbi:spore coat protein CotJB [Paenisporosarcina cavernae]|uniref:Protein CotJB domain-containing protein n=1 Tax=Paenisporosarcina cavernae TaxID=2320858 RepID=A0A385YX97_9BACL|nr:spore coat protein CotJB [Paenisporosarcina cavernae]AYC30132.1 hypothetical protein D3873_09695 [Paenisporosarcina cavernae]
MTEEQRSALYQVQVADFIMLEWVLYLHTHPDDLEAKEKWQDATMQATEARCAYEAQYGPLINGTLECTTATPWPWHV